VWSVKWSVQMPDTSLRGVSTEPRPRCFTSYVIFYGLATWERQSVEEFFLTREEAEDCLQSVLEDEPEWAEVVGLVRLDFSSEQPEVEVLA
jgi:hypothetical protein